MTRLEMVEKLCEKTGVSYDVARDTLEENNWDIIDAIVVLDKQGREIHDGETSGAPSEAGASKPVTTAPSKLRGFIKWQLGMIKKGEDIRINITHREEDSGSISLTVLILLLMLKWYIPVGLWIISLFFGFRYHLSGSSATGKLLNSLSDKASNKAEEIRSSMSEDE